MREFTYTKRDNRKGEKEAFETVAFKFARKLDTGPRG